MSALALLQQDFRASMLGDDDAPGMAVYRHTYRAQLLACLADTFPVLHDRMGEDAFATLSIAYALAHPPQSWSLDHFPAGFAEWLAASGQSAWHVDLARIEWALAESFVAPDQAALSLADIATIDWDSARLRPIAAVHLLALTTNAAAIWMAAQEDITPPEPLMQPATMLVWRRQEQCYLREAAPDETEGLRQSDQSFADLTATLCDRLGEEQGVAHAGTLLAQWAQDGLCTVAMPDQGADLVVARAVSSTSRVNTSGRA